VDRQAASEKLAGLARLDERVKLDRAAGVARIEMPLAFQGPSATLTAEDKRRLDDVARLLKSKDAKELGVVVSGGTGTRGGGEERARAVVDYLDRHGIARERLEMGPAKSGAGRLVMEIVGGEGPVAELPASGDARRR
jgi:outer membrane protein OmpA-like peptidoglycan-associated protein